MRNPYLSREWRQYIVGDDVPVVWRTDEHPVESGVYFLFGPDDMLQYVGMSYDIRYRMAQHHWSGRQFDWYGAVSVPGDLMLPVEIAYIHALEPPLNRKFDAPPYPDVHALMVQAIRERWTPEPSI